MIFFVYFFVFLCKILNMDQIFTDRMHDELQIRWDNLQTRMKAENVNACLITSNVDIYYMLGRIISGYVYILQEGEPWIFVRKPVELEGDKVRYIRKAEQIPDILAAEGIALPNILLMEGDELPYSEWMRYQDALRPVAVVNGSSLIRELRSVKTEYELEQLKFSARLQSQALREVPLLYRSGMTDHQLTVEVERIFRLKGCLGAFRIYGRSMEAFMGSTLVGDNAAYPSPFDFALGGEGMHPSLPIGHKGTLLEPGMSVMIDINGNFSGYISDQSRTFSIGKIDEKADYAHRVSLDIQDELAEMGKPGVSCGELYDRAMEIVVRHNLQDCFMGTKQQAKFVGHGIGLVINELPVICGNNKMELKEGNAIALEPKFVINGVGAVGTENSFIVKNNGMEKITFAPEEIIEL